MTEIARYVPLVLVLLVLAGIVAYCRRPGTRPPETGSWLDPRAFGFAFLLVLVVQVSKLLGEGATSQGIAAGLVASLVGGTFWGAIGTYVWRKSRRT